MTLTKQVKHVFLVGAKSLGAYGGYETFINKLTEYHKDNSNIKYHVACKANGDGYMDERTLSGVSDIVIKNNQVVEFTYHNAHCFKIQVPEKFGAAQAIYYDIISLNKCCEIIESNNITSPIVYIMACRIGPFIKYFYKKIHKLGGKIYLNPDGHEWMRAKWSPIIRKYWRFSEKLMVKYCDLAVCDSVNIEKYIHTQYDGKCRDGKDPKTTFIAYGAETRKSILSNESQILVDWYCLNDIKPKEYYLIVGRFVPENNFETMIREFMNSHSKKKLAIITNVNNYFLTSLEKKLHFSSDPRIKFVGTVYDQELLKKIRENAYAYIHGHEVGGTNPSLLEALGSTDLNLLLDVGFNKEVAEDSSLYWNKSFGDLARVIDKADSLSLENIRKFGEKAKKRISVAYNWDLISQKYADVFCN